MREEGMLLISYEIYLATGTIIEGPTEGSTGSYVKRKNFHFKDRDGEKKGPSG